MQTPPQLATERPPPPVLIRLRLLFGETARKLPPPLGLTPKPERRLLRQARQPTRRQLLQPAAPPPLPPLRRQVPQLKRGRRLPRQLPRRPPPLKAAPLTQPMRQIANTRPLLRPKPTRQQPAKEVILRPCNARRHLSAAPPPYANRLTAG